MNSAFESARIPIRTYLAIKPLGYEANREESLIIRSSTQVALSAPVYGVSSRTSNYTFDHIFPPQTKGDDIMVDCVEDLISEFLEGVSVQIVVSGSHNSGKSRLLNGSRGIVQTAFIRIWQNLNENFKNTNFSAKEHILKMRSYDLIEVRESPFLFVERVMDNFSRFYAARMDSHSYCDLVETSEGFVTSNVHTHIPKTLNEGIDLLIESEEKRQSYKYQARVNSVTEFELYQSLGKNDHLISKMMIVETCASNSLALSDADLCRSEGYMAYHGLNSLYKILEKNQPYTPITPNSPLLVRLLHDYINCGHCIGVFFLCLSQENTTDVLASSLQLAQSIRHKHTYPTPVNAPLYFIMKNLRSMTLYNKKAQASHETEAERISQNNCIQELRSMLASCEKELIMKSNVVDELKLEIERLEQELKYNLEKRVQEEKKMEQMIVAYEELVRQHNELLAEMKHDREQWNKVKALMETQMANAESDSVAILLQLKDTASRYEKLQSDYWNLEKSFNRVSLKFEDAEAKARYNIEKYRALEKTNEELSYELSRLMKVEEDLVLRLQRIGEERKKEELVKEGLQSEKDKWILERKMLSEELEKWERRGEEDRNKLVSYEVMLERTTTKNADVEIKREKEIKMAIGERDQEILSLREREKDWIDTVETLKQEASLLRDINQKLKDQTSVLPLASSPPPKEDKETMEKKEGVETKRRNDPKPQVEESIWVMRVGILQRSIEKYEQERATLLSRASLAEEQLSLSNDHNDLLLAKLREVLPSFDISQLTKEISPDVKNSDKEIAFN